MPQPATPLPVPLLGPAPFRVRDAHRAGVTPQRLRRPDLETPRSGIRWAAALPRDLADLARAISVALPEEVAFSHVTAARLLGLPLPRPWTPAEPLDVMRPTAAPRLERAQCRSHRGLESREVVTVDGLRVVSGWDTWADLSPGLAVGDLVALGDALLAPRGPGRRSDAWDVVASRPGRRGVRRLRSAADLVRPGSASAWESKARVLFLDAGLPEPELNVDLFADDGSWLARPDFVWRRRRVVGEYDGDQHRTDRRVWQYERERRARLEDDGWRYVEMTSLSLTSPPRRRALLRRLGALLL